MTVAARSDDGQATAELTAEVMELRERVGRAEERAEAAERVAEAKVDAAQADAIAKERIIGELREEWAWHRQPWWRRWLM